MVPITSGNGGAVPLRRVTPATDPGGSTVLLVRPLVTAVAASLAVVPLSLATAGTASAAGPIARVVTAADTAPNSMPVEERFSAAQSGGGGGVSFVQGPATAPLGAGSLRLATPSSADKANLASGQLSEPTQVNSFFAGQPLASLEINRFSTYRSSASTGGNATVQPSVQIAVYKNGISDFASFILEPVYVAQQNGGQAPANDVWQTWQAAGAKGWYDKSVATNGNAGTTLADLKAANPNARVLAVAINLGSGSTGTIAYADALEVTVGGVNAVYDFEPDALPAPVVPEVPVAALLPLTAMAMAGVVVWRRRRGATA